MQRSASAGVVAVLALGLAASPLDAQDIDAMARWTSAEVIHYDVSAVYSGETVILLSSNGSVTGYRTQVTDQYEMSFDWNPTEMTLVGTPVVKNFPSALPRGMPARSMGGQSCPQPRVSGSFDLAEVVTVKDGTFGSNSLELGLKRSYPAGGIPYAAEGPCTNWADAPAKAETIPGGLMVLPGLFLAMPTAGGANVTVGKDGKTMVLEDKPNGWTYTYTLKIVK